MNKNTRDSQVIFSGDIWYDYIGDIPSIFFIVSGDIRNVREIIVCIDV